MFNTVKKSSGEILPFHTMTGAKELTLPNDLLPQHHLTQSSGRLSTREQTAKRFFKDSPTKGDTDLLKSMGKAFKGFYKTVTKTKKPGEAKVPLTARGSAR